MQKCFYLNRVLCHWNREIRASLTLCNGLNARQFIFIRVTLRLGFSAAAVAALVKTTCRALKQESAQFPDVWRQTRSGRSCL